MNRGAHSLDNDQCRRFVDPTVGYAPVLESARVETVRGGAVEGVSHCDARSDTNGDANGEMTWKMETEEGPDEEEIMIFSDWC